MKGNVLLKLALINCLNSAIGASAETGSEATRYPVPDSFLRYGPSFLSAFMAVVDDRLGSVRESLRILAAAEEVKSGRWEKMSSLFAARQAGDDSLVLWYVQTDGSYCTLTQGRVDKKLSDRPYFPGLMEGKEVLGPCVVNKSTGQKSVIVAVPAKAGERVVGAVGASVFLDDLNESVRKSLGFPEGIIWFALAPDGRSPLAHLNELILNSPFAQESPTLKAAAKQMREQEAGALTYEFLGDVRHVIFRTSPLTGWRYVVGIVLGPAR